MNAAMAMYDGPMNWFRWLARRLAVALLGVVALSGVLFLLAFLFVGPAAIAYSRMALWTVGELIYSTPETVDPRSVRALAKDPSSIKDLGEKGKALRIAIDEIYAALPETRQSWLADQLIPSYKLPVIDISNIVKRYIPVGTNFKDAEEIIQAAGIPIVWPRPLPAERVRMKAAGRDEYTIRGSITEAKVQPPSYMRLSIDIRPAVEGDYSDEGKVGSLSAGMVKEIGAPMPPVSFPIKLDDPSSELTVTIRVERRREYLFQLDFRPSRLSEAEAYQNLAGSSARNSGLVIPLRLTMTKDVAAIPQIDKVIEARAVPSGGYLRLSKVFYAAILEPGTYHFRVSSAKELPELRDIRIDFSVTYDTRFN